jgi:hypothetical protein
MSIQPKNSWLYQGLALLLWLACMESAWSSSLSAFSKDRPKITPYLLRVDPPASALRSDTAPALAPDPPRKSYYKRSRKQVHAHTVQAIGTATLGSLSITRSFGAVPHQNNWLSPLAFTMTFASAIGVLYVVQQPSKGGNKTARDIYPQTALPNPLGGSDRKSIEATAGIYWNKRLYKGRATEIGPQSMRVEVDEVMSGLQIWMPVGLIISQGATEIPKRFLVQVVAIHPLATGGKPRCVLELQFPKRWKQQQSQKVKELITSCIR